MLGSFKSLSTFLADTGCVYARGRWEDGKSEDAILKTKISPDDLLPLDYLPMFLEVLAIRFSDFYKFLFRFYILFYVMFIPFGSITDLQSYNSCACWHQTSGESTATIPIAKMPTAATEIPVAMDVAPNIAGKKNL